MNYITGIESLVQIDGHQVIINRGWSDYVTGGNCANQNTGGDLSHNNVQPSVGVVRWHRIS